MQEEPIKVKQEKPEFEPSKIPLPNFRPSPSPVPKERKEKQPKMQEEPIKVKQEKPEFTPSDIPLPRLQPRPSPVPKERVSMLASPRHRQKLPAQQPALSHTFGSGQHSSLPTKQC